MPCFTKHYKEGFSLLKGNSRRLEPRERGGRELEEWRDVSKTKSLKKLHDPQ